VSFVPLSGPATLHAADSPRDGTVEFRRSGEKRFISVAAAAE